MVERQRDEIRSASLSVGFLKYYFIKSIDSIDFIILTLSIQSSKPLLLLCQTAHDKYSYQKYHYRHQEAPKPVDFERRPTNKKILYQVVSHT